MEWIWSTLNFINTNFLGIIMPFALMASGLLIGVRLRFFYLLHPVKVFKMLGESDKKNGVSPFKAMTVALAGSLGVGNIVGVATAITAGGAGAIFWMWISAVFAMVIKYAEVALAVHYRRIRKDDYGTSEYYGGAMYYLRDGLLKNNTGFLKKFLPSFFALLCVLNSLTTGNIVQINAAANSSSLPPILIGSVTAFIVMYVIIGGAKRISDFTVKLIPFLALIYLALSFYIIAINTDKIGSVFQLIFDSAFEFDAAFGGILGFFISFFSRSARLGVTRGVLSNEAGCGTAPTAHASAETVSPAHQGCWGLFEVFVDTIVLCTMTAVVILLSYSDLVLIGKFDGIQLSILAYERFAGEWAGTIITISVMLFAFATIICQWFYASEAIKFITKSKIPLGVYFIVYIVSIICGSVITPAHMWILADFTVSFMTIINTTAVVMMSNTVKNLTLPHFNQKK